jgi:hypothetical protein
MYVVCSQSMLDTCNPSAFGKRQRQSGLDPTDRSTTRMDAGARRRDDPPEVVSGPMLTALKRLCTIFGENRGVACHEVYAERGQSACRVRSRASSSWALHPPGVGANSRLPKPQEFE